MFLGFPIIPNYIASCHYECHILWDIEWKLDYCAYYLFLKFHYFRRSNNELKSHGELLIACKICYYVFQGEWLFAFVKFCQEINWVWYALSIVIPIVNIIMCIWHDVHLCNHFLKFSCMQQYSFIRYHQLIAISSTNLFYVLPYFSSFSQIKWVSSILCENWSLFSTEHSSHSFCCFSIFHKANI